MKITKQHIKTQRVFRQSKRKPFRLWMAGSLFALTGCTSTFGRLEPARDPIHAVDRFLPHNNLTRIPKTMYDHVVAANRISDREHPFVEPGWQLLRPPYLLQMVFRLPFALTYGAIEGVSNFFRAEANEIFLGEPMQYKSATQLAYENTNDRFIHPLNWFNHNGYRLIYDYIDRGGDPNFQFSDMVSYCGSERITLLELVATDYPNKATQKTIDYLVQRGANPLRKNHLGESLVQASCVRDNQFALAKLLQYHDGALLTEVNAAGETPLIFAMKCRALNCFSYLLAQGADPTIRDRSGKNALDWLDDLPDFWEAIGQVPGAPNNYNAFLVGRRTKPNNSTIVTQELHQGLRITDIEVVRIFTEQLAKYDRQ